MKAIVSLKTFGLWIAVLTDQLKLLAVTSYSICTPCITDFDYLLACHDPIRGVDCRTRCYKPDPTRASAAIIPKMELALGKAKVRKLKTCMESTRVLT